jgi:hypothetical protein
MSRFTQILVVVSILLCAAPSAHAWFWESFGDSAAVISAQMPEDVSVLLSLSESGKFVFSHCVHNMTSSGCHVMGRKAGYSSEELKSRLTELDRKARLRKIAKVSAPIAGFVLGARAGYKMGKGAEIQELGTTVGVFFMALLGGAGGAAVSVGISQSTPNYAEQADSLRQTLANGAGVYISMPGAAPNSLLKSLYQVLAGI